MKFLTLFAGGGLADLGIRLAGHHTAVAIEREEWIADLFKLNFPNTTVINEDCNSVDYSQFKSLEIDAIWASPPCQDASIARSKDLPRHKDADAGYSLIDAIENIRPRYLFIENVPQWLKTPVWTEVRDFLFKQGYWVSENVLNASDYGIPQNRKRAIIRASLGCFVPPLPHKSSHSGWYNAIRFLKGYCPEVELTNWQKEWIKEEITEPCLIPHVGARKSSFRLIGKDEPCPTIRALGCDRHYRQFDYFDGKIFRQLTPECESVLQTMPPYNFGYLPSWRKKRIIGNGVPCSLVHQLLKEFK